MRHCIGVTPEKLTFFIIGTCCSILVLGLENFLGGVVYLEVFSLRVKQVEAHVAEPVLCSRLNDRNIGLELSAPIK